MRGLLHTCSFWNNFFIAEIFLLFSAVNKKAGRAHIVHMQSVSAVMEWVQERG